MYKKMLYGIMLIMLFFVIVFSILNINSPKKESFEYIQAIAYKSMRHKCLSENDVIICDGIMIHDIYGRLNGESPNPDGFVFNFSNTVKPAFDTIVYRVIIMNNGSVFEIKKMDANTIYDLSK